MPIPSANDTPDAETIDETCPHPGSTASPNLATGLPSANVDPDPEIEFIDELLIEIDPDTEIDPESELVVLGMELLSEVIVACDWAVANDDRVNCELGEAEFEFTIEPEDVPVLETELLPDPVN